MELQHHWQQRTWLSLVLLPLSAVFAFISSLRRWAYATGVLRRHAFDTPIVVVGNISVGGTGKTPLVIHLVRTLTARGLHVGVVSRGYGASAQGACEVTETSDPGAVGDEPVLIARRTGAPMWIATDRPSAVRELLSRHPCDVVISDDGLQHYALARNVEIAVVDGTRGLGNGRRLPAGPLRESAARLREVDLVVSNGAWPGADCTYSLQVGEVSRLGTDETRSLDSFAGQRVHAVAAIGHPERFFTQLESHGLDIQRHAFADHHAFQQGDITFGDALPVLMTEKDAVKCEQLSGEQLWVVSVDVMDESQCVTRKVLELLER